MMAAEAYPLQWPEGWPRTPSHKRGGSRFGKNMGFNQIGKLQNEAIHEDPTLSNGDSK